MKHGTLDNEVFPYRAEIVIIGGGLSGSSTAFWLKERFRDEDFKVVTFFQYKSVNHVLQVVVVENNDVFTKSSTMLSTGGITQQFSIPEFVDMSLFTTEFLRHAGEHLRILGIQSKNKIKSNLSVFFQIRNNPILISFQPDI